MIPRRAGRRQEKNEGDRGSWADVTSVILLKHIVLKHHRNRKERERTRQSASERAHERERERETGRRGEREMLQH